MSTHPAKLLKEYGLYASKRRGQNYLCQPATAEAIVAAAAIGKQDTVVEIGAGLGALTLPLATRAAKVVALEIDRGIFQALQGIVAPFPNVEAKLMDAMDFDWSALNVPVRVVGNLPYSISSPLLFSLLENMGAWKSATLMLQRELAARLNAAPDTKAYGRLSVLLQSMCVMRENMVVGPDNFFPRPGVDSLVFTLTPREAPVVPKAEQAWFGQVVKAAFAQRRKTLLNSLGSVLPISRELLTCKLESAGFNPSCRAETLGVERLAALARALQNHGRP